MNDLNGKSKVAFSSSSARYSKTIFIKLLSKNTRHRQARPRARAYAISANTEKTFANSLTVFLSVFISLTVCLLQRWLHSPFFFPPVSACTCG